MRVFSKARPRALLSFVTLSLVLTACAAEPETIELVEAAPGNDSAAAPMASQAASAAGSALTDRVWVQADSSDLPGKMRIFLSNGTLLMDSCWETYRLAAWRRIGGDSLLWSEDGQEIRAELLEESDQALRIRLALIGGAEEENYRPATIPYVCPDMVR